MDLLLNKCGVPATRKELYKLCLQYQIPFSDGIRKELSNSNIDEAELWLISRSGVEHTNAVLLQQQRPVIFKSINSLDLYLFVYVLRNGIVLIHKGKYRTYLNTIKKLKCFGIEGIDRKSFFSESQAFCICDGRFTNIPNEFGLKCLSSYSEAVQFLMDEFLDLLNRLLIRETR